MTRHRFAFATREWQRDSIVEALDGKSYTHRFVVKGWAGRQRYEEQLPLTYTISRTTWCGVKVWAFSTGRVEAAEAARQTVRWAAVGWFQPGDRAVFAADMFDGTPAGTGVTIVAINAGDIYIRIDGRAAVLSEDGEPDLYRTPQVGPWWLDREVPA